MKIFQENAPEFVTKRNNAKVTFRTNHTGKNIGLFNSVRHIHQTFQWVIPIFLFSTKGSEWQKKFS